jgi:hypothetical protein
MMKYRVNWTEYHEVEVEAEDDAEARELSLRMNDTRRSVYAHEVHPEDQERVRFELAAMNPSVTQKEPIWCVVLKNIRASGDGIRLQSDAWSYRHDCSDIDQEFYEIIAKTRPVREEC